MIASGIALHNLPIYFWRAFTDQEKNTSSVPMVFTWKSVQSFKVGAVRRQVLRALMYLITLGSIDPWFEGMYLPQWVGRGRGNDVANGVA